VVEGEGTERLAPTLLEDVRPDGHTHGDDGEHDERQDLHGDQYRPPARLGGA
jgi:hypothetical protein